MSHKLFPLQYGEGLGRLEHSGAVIDESVGNQTREDRAGAGSFFGVSIPRKRFLIAGTIASAAFVLLGARAGQLQIARGASYAAIAAANRFAREQMVPPRGRILDAHGKVLVQNVPAFALMMRISDVPKDDPKRTQVLEKVASLSGLSRTDLELMMTQYAATPFASVAVKRGIAYEPAMLLAIETAMLPGFRLEPSTVRAYDTSAPSLSHVLGYTGKISVEELKAAQGENRLTDEVGKNGMEKSGQHLLRGQDGVVVREVDARGKVISVLSQTPAVKGADLILTIDVGLQREAERTLRAALLGAHASRGSVVAMDPQTGAVLALVSVPSYDANAFAQGISTQEYEAWVQDPDHPLFSRAIAGEFPSGSTFKPFVAYAALAEGLINERTSFLSTGGLAIGAWFFPDWKAGGHGITDVRRAIAESVNTFFYIIGGGLGDVPGLGVERITEAAAAFGFGSKTGIELPGESDGFLPSKDWKEKTKGERWYVGDTYHLAIGQGDVLVTPLQMAGAISVIANGGHVIAPHLILAVDGGAAGAWRAFEKAPEVSKEFSGAHIQTVREGMRQTVTRGSAQSLGALPYPVAGKTGTAQIGGDHPPHAWFAGFGPYQDPTITIVVLLEEGGEGSRVAVPVASEMFRWWFSNRHTPSE